MRLNGTARLDGAAVEDTDHERDLLFIDQRGTGESAPLQCRLRDPADPQSYLADYFPPDAVARCLDELRKRAVAHTQAPEKRAEIEQHDLGAGRPRAPQPRRASQRGPRGPV